MGSVEIKKDTGKYGGSCSCCPGRAEVVESWEVQFKLGTFATVITLCREHLVELQISVGAALE